MTVHFAACALTGGSGAIATAAGAGYTADDVTIQLAAGSTGSYLGTLTITGSNEHSLTLDGAGSATSILSGNGTTQTADLHASFPITLENLGLDNGSESGGDGGNLEVDSGSGVVTLSSDTIEGGTTTGNGGGVSITGTTVVIDDTQISDNSTPTGNVGGGLLIFTGSTVTVEDSTISGNAASGGGAGIDLQSSSTLTVEDSTIANNAGEALLTSGTARVYGSTIAGNTTAGIDLEGGGTLQIGASVLANNNGEDCFEGTLTDDGYNYADDSSCSTSASTSHDSESSLSVGALGAHGGPTPTMQITNASEAYDVVPTGTTLGTEAGAFCSAADQRGVPRTQGAAAACDAGAYQYAPPVVTAVSPASTLELGLAVTLSGAGFGNLTAVRFGSTAATITGQTNTSLSLTVPLTLAFGSQPITLVNPDSPGGVAVAFTAVADPGVATIALPAAQLGVAYSQTVPVTGGRAPFSFQLVSGVLPPGLTVSAAGIVSGTPTKSGGSAFTMSVTDANGIASASQTVSLTVATPIIEIKTTAIKLKGRDAQVMLSCKFSPCVGTAKLIEYVKVTVKKKTKTMAVTLGSATYTLAAGAHGAAQMILLAKGDHVLAHVNKHHLKEAVTASVHGGETAVTPVVVS
jgi:parallel beta-helix repeat protein